MIGMAVAGNASILRNLVSLSIYDLPIAVKPTITEVLLILEQSPQLRMLRLSACLTHSVDGLDIPMASKVHGLRLREMHLYLDTELNVALLEHLVIPPEIALRIQCNSYPLLEPIPIIPPHLCPILYRRSYRIELCRQKTDILGFDVNSGNASRTLEFNLYISTSTQPLLAGNAYLHSRPF